jgi:transforming growth factor-beta-induced protein
MKKKLIIYVNRIFLFTIAFIAFSCKKESLQNTPEQVSIYTIIKSDPVNFSLLREVVEKAGLQSYLESGSGLTLLAPSDEAFINAGLTLSVIKASTPELLKNILEYHLLSKTLVLDESLINGEQTTLNSTTVYISKTNLKGYAVNGADITNRNNLALNGVLHVVNSVLIPAAGKFIYQRITENSNLSFLGVAIRRASEGSKNIIKDLSSNGNYTLFAPTNAAFIAAGFSDTSRIKTTDPELLINILTYHLLNNRKFTVDMIDSLGLPALNQKLLFLNNRTINPSRVSYTRGLVNGVSFDRVNANIMANNGVLHMISEVFTPPSQSLNQTISNTSTLSFLAAAISRASQGSTNFTVLLNGASFNTIIAPTNTAFIAAGFADINAINSTSPAVLASILNHHILSGNRFLYQFRNGTLTEPLSGISIAVTVNSSNGAVSLAGGANLSAIALIKSFDFITNNGLLYTVNQLLKP